VINFSFYVLVADISMSSHSDNNTRWYQENRHYRKLVKSQGRQYVY